jgi:two-component system chemotaxis sensor kinase CheA
MSPVQHAQEDNLVAELLPAFIQEANEQVAAFEQLLLELEDAPGDHELLDALFRCAHTVKGSAGVFGLDRVVAFTHHVESLLDQLREGQLQLTPGLSTLLLQSNDAIRDLVATANEAATEVAEQQRAALVVRLRDAAGHSAQAAQDTAAQQAEATSATPTAQRCWRVSVRFGGDTFRNGMDPITILSYVGKLGCIEDLACERNAVPGLDALDPEHCHLAFAFALHTAAGAEQIEHAFAFVRDDCELTLEELRGATDAPSAMVADAPVVAVAAAPVAAPTRPRDAASVSAMADEGGFIRVHANRLDEVINLLGELVIAGAGAALQARETRQRGLIEAHQQMTRLIEGIRNSTLKLRMVPIGETFARFRRVVRDTASELGKDVVLEIVGGDTELDKAVVERIADPLMHLIRNALDHGLETPEQRVAAGKPAQGHLTLSACHESGAILIRIIDDGRGIQRDKVLERAWQRGLLEHGVVPPDDQILKLIFEPGFSTAEKVTNLSGRGVGMDVVRRNIEALRGSVAIDSVPGQGSTMEIRLPLTLAIIDGFLVGVGDSRFIVPLDAVVEVIASHTEEVALDKQGRGCVNLRGHLLPVIDLRTLYALNSPAPERSSVLVVGLGNRRYGVVVDNLLGQHQTVIKPLGRMLCSLRGMSGSSILGTGEVALIFDVEALGQLAAGPMAATARTHVPEDLSAAAAAATTPAGEPS